MTDKCAFENCEEPAVFYAAGRRYGNPERKQGHPGVAKYCAAHADLVSREPGGTSEPEYIVDCPHCGCLFGVN